MRIRTFLNFGTYFVNYCVAKSFVKFKIFILKKNYVILLVLSELYIRSYVKKLRFYKDKPIKTHVKIVISGIYAE